MEQPQINLGVEEKYLVTASAPAVVTGQTQPKMISAQQKGHENTMLNVLHDIKEQKKILEDQLRMTQNKLHDQQTQYFSLFSHYGNVIKGWDGMKNKQQKYQPKNKPKKQQMLFSGSSSTTRHFQTQEYHSYLDSSSYPSIYNQQQISRSNKKNRKKARINKYNQDEDSDYQQNC